MNVKIEKLENFLDFWGKIVPPLQEFAQWLFRETGGNPAKAVQMLKRIPDHWGASYEAAEREIDKELEELSAAREAPEKEPIEEAPAEG
jgi:hypothetical protein